MLKTSESSNLSEYELENGGNEVDRFSGDYGVEIVKK